MKKTKIHKSGLGIISKIFILLILLLFLVGLVLWMNDDPIFTGIEKKLVSLVSPVELPKTSYNNINDEEVLRLVNEERVKENLKPLKINQKLQIAASNKAKDMFLKQYFGHYGADGLSPWNFINGAGYEYNYAGENLGMGIYEPEELVKKWMSSEEHRDNILNRNFKETGVAVVFGKIFELNSVIIVQEFGKSK